jgi:hypothetical protein
VPLRAFRRARAADHAFVESAYRTGVLLRSHADEDVAEAAGVLLNYVDSYRVGDATIAHVRAALAGALLAGEAANSDTAL